ncbi:cytochrome P450 family protein [Nonomuraea rhizosphaerae]|uniref:cytochrome P450 family protein n=1 Tax=Nonomuraea rhizosphaerae TaxID=2665663 RepID=UPI001C5EC4B8|nr:cytochrome P450 [Nonomuraea rhizosphaerae]
MTNRTLVIFGPWGRPASQGWRVRTPTVPVDDRDACVAAITDYLAAPDSPDRAVLLGHGTAAAAVLEVADRHPERAAAVVAVGVPGAPGALDAAHLCCPSLILDGDGDGQDDGERVESFLSSLEPGLKGDGEARCPARLPALTPVLLNDPEVIRQLRDMGPVHRVNAPGVSTSWILTGHQASTVTLADAALSGRTEITAGFRLQGDVEHRGEQDLITIDGREHARLRRLVGQHLTPRRMEALRPRLQRATDELLDAIPTGEPVDLVRAFARPLPIVVLCELLGVPARDRDYIADWLLVRMNAVPPRAHEDVDEYLRALIEARKVVPADDLLGWVVRAEGGRLCEDDLVAASRLLMVGGHRAPTTLLANGVAALLRDGEQWRRLVADPSLVEGAVEELLRYVTPFPVGLARTVTAPVEVGGRRIPAGDLVAASLVAANRDPSHFEEPDALDVDRAPNPHLAFGHGHHFCLGAALARIEARIAIETLTRRFPGTELAHDARDLHYRQNRVRYLLELPVVLSSK